MKKHFLLIVALLTMVLNVTLLAWFLRRMEKITVAQADSRITRPEAHRESPVDESDALRLNLRADGKVYANGAELSDFGFAQLITANPDRRITVEAALGVNYEQVKTLLQRLRAAGKNKIVLKIHNE